MYSIACERTRISCCRFSCVRRLCLRRLSSICLVLARLVTNVLFDVTRCWMKMLDRLEGSSGKLPTSKNLIIETRNEKIYTKVKSRAKRVKMAFDSPRLNKVSDSASLISGSSSSGFQIQITVAISLITDQTTRPKAFSMFKMAAGITTHNWPQSWIALDNNLH